MAESVTPPQNPTPELAPEKPDWRRPNPSRSIEVFGEFNDDLACKLLPQIQNLRHESNDAVTVYINSVGGGILVLKYISGLLDSKSLDRKWCRTVSVATGTAASAGAILLAYGDYAYAYEHSLIHFHGIRTDELPENFEDAAQVMARLERTQREVIQKLSRCLIRRVIYRYQKLNGKFNLNRKDVEDKELVALNCFVDAICQEISPNARALVRQTYKNIVQAKSLTDKILPKVKAGKSRTGVRSDAKVLIGVIKHEISEHEKKRKHWRIDERGAAQIMSDYLIMRDYTMGDHLEIMGGILDNYGFDFLEPNDREEFNKIKSDDRVRRRSFLVDKTFRILEPLWYYTVSLCRALFTGENRLMPEDAYWMGIIDEVIGTEMVGFRVVAEQKRKQPTKAVSP
jgi:ATP-dependent protease ClpP protease subunit